MSILKNEVEDEEYIMEMCTNRTLYSILLHVFCSSVICENQTPSEFKNIKHNVFILKLMDQATGFCWFKQVGNKSNFMFMVKKKISEIFGNEGYPQTITCLNQGLCVNHLRYFLKKNCGIEFDNITKYGSSKYDEVGKVSNEFVINISKKV